jgi:hypothetical protein
MASAGPSDPGSWNRYSYTRGDTVNRGDRRGLCDYDVSNGQYYDTYSGWQEAAYLGSASFTDNVYETTSCGADGGGDDGGYVGDGGAGNEAATPPDCNSIIAAVGFAGLTYKNALEIWNDGSLSSYQTDSAAATVAALSAVTWQGESSFSLNPTNNGNYSKTGVLLSVDYGPFQINQHYNPNSNQAVWGTSGAGLAFDGNPDANISFGIQILEGLKARYGNTAAGHYVGNLNQPNARKRQSTWDTWKTKLTGLFSNTDCFSHP